MVTVADPVRNATYLQHELETSADNGQRLNICDRDIDSGEALSLRTLLVDADRPRIMNGKLTVDWERCAGHHQSPQESDSTLRWPNLQADQSSFLECRVEWR